MALKLALFFLFVCTFQHFLPRVYGHMKLVIEDRKTCKFYCNIAVNKQRFLCINEKCEDDAEKGLPDLLYRKSGASGLCLEIYSDMNSNVTFCEQLAQMKQNIGDTIIVEKPNSKPPSEQPGNPDAPAVADDKSPQGDIIKVEKPNSKTPSEQPVNPDAPAVVDDKSPQGKTLNSSVSLEHAGNGGKQEGGNADAIPGRNSNSKFNSKQPVNGDGLEGVDDESPQDAIAEKTNSSVSLEHVGNGGKQEGRNENLSADEDQLKGLEPNLMETQKAVTPKLDKNEDESNFFIYFFVISLLLLLFYFVIYKKKKIMALLLEGRRTPSKRRYSRSYDRLNCNLEEAMLSESLVPSNNSFPY